MTDNANTDIDLIIDQLIDEYGDSPALDAFFSEMQDVGDVSAISEMSHKPVSIETFVTDDYFMGRFLHNVWDTTVESVKEVIGGGYSEAIFTGSIGRAKCFAKGTLVLMADGSTKAIEEVRAGDSVMGENSQPKLVTGTANGFEQMYRVNQIRGESYVVNESHILSLKATNGSWKSGQLVNISVSDYLALPEWKRKVLKGWSPELVVFPEKQQPEVDPYLLGVWLGDGESLGTRFTTPDIEIVEYLDTWARENNQNLSRYEIPNNKADTYTLSGSGRVGGNVFRNYLKNNQLLGNKHIPEEVKTGSPETRFKVLAGLLDTDGGLHKDGSNYKIVQKREQLASEIAFVARSLGFRVVMGTQTVNGITYHTCSISGETHRIPLLIERKKATPRRQKKNILRRGINIEKLEVGEFFGITLSGENKLFLLADYTVVHNTTRATIITAYNLYTLSCYQNPQRRLGLMENSDLYIAMINKTDSQARKVTYAKFRKLIEKIPYFQENFMFDKTVESEMRFPKNIFVIPSNANNENLLGMDVVSGIIDEINFFAYVERSKRSNDGGVYDQAAEVYDGLVMRIKSRFEGIAPELRGCLSVVSSRSYNGDFTQRRIEEVEEMEKAGKPIYTYVSTGSQWDFIPNQREDGSVRFSETRFKVAIGNARYKSEIIETETDPLGREVIEVPDNFREQFEKNIEKALKDLAGRVSGSTGSYFTNPEIVWNAVDLHETSGFDKLFTAEEWQADRPYEDLFNKKFRLKNPSTPRFLHLDLSLTGDLTGIAIGHSPSDIETRKYIHQKNYELDRAPVVVYDGLLAIRPPKNGEIEYAKVRKFIYFLVEEVGIPLKRVSADGFQSSDFLQIIKGRLGVETVKISVEGEEPYKQFKNAFEENRILIPRHTYGIDEILHLVQDEKTKRVDHPASSSKDVADGACGVYKNIMTHFAKGELYSISSKFISGLYSTKRR